MIALLKTAPCLNTVTLVITRKLSSIAFQNKDFSVA